MTFFLNIYKKGIMGCCKNRFKDCTQSIVILQTRHYELSHLTFCLVSFGTFPAESVAEELWDRSSLVRLSYRTQFPKQIVFSISIILLFHKNGEVLEQLFLLVWMVESQKIKLHFSLWQLSVRSSLYFEMYINNWIRFGMNLFLANLALTTVSVITGSSLC